MKTCDLSKMAEDCRAHAATLRGPERTLLLQVADAFQELAWSRKARNFVEVTRCW